MMLCTHTHPFTHLPPTSPVAEYWMVKKYCILEISATKDTKTVFPVLIKSLGNVLQNGTTIDVVLSFPS